MSITQQQLQQILPNAGQSAGVFVPVLNTAMSRYQIVGENRIAAFIAQVGHESGQLTRLVENLNYGADALRDLVELTLIGQGVESPARPEPCR